MSKISREEIESEFDQKLRESMAGKQDNDTPLPPAAEVRHPEETRDSEETSVSEVLPVSISITHRPVL